MSAYNLREWIVTAERAGWTVRGTRSHHLRWTPPGGKGFVITPGTTRRPHALKNIRAALRRAGLEV